MWGIRLLEGGNTAVERREFRSSRRRLERNKYRLNCLEMLFNEEISKKDIAFFQRLKDSALYDGDKNVSGKYSLFNDPDYTDKDYYKKYPTIYHLRKELIESVEPHDALLGCSAGQHKDERRGYQRYKDLVPQKQPEPCQSGDAAFQRFDRVQYKNSRLQRHA